MSTGIFHKATIVQALPNNSSIRNEEVDELLSGDKEIGLPKGLARFLNRQPTESCRKARDSGSIPDGGTTDVCFAKVRSSTGRTSVSKTDNLGSIPSESANNA